MSTGQRKSTEWVGDGLPAKSLFLDMAEHHFVRVSPSYEAIARAVADDDELLSRLDALPSAKRQPNLLLGAVRYVDGPTDSADDFVRWTHENWATVVDVVMTHRTQTNEPRRCATLLPTLAALPQPLALIEVGASAGLCLQPDRYGYRYHRVGDERSDNVQTVGDSRLMLDCVVTGDVPIPSAVPTVVWRRGLDLNPLDVRSDDDVRWLRALIWPEQTDRFASFDAAVAIAREDPPVVEPGDLLTDLGRLVQQAPGHATVVICHSAVLAYLSPAQRGTFVESLTTFGRDVVWIANEAPGIVTDIDPGPRRDTFVLTRDRVPLAWTGPHGHSLDWIA